MKVTVKSKNSKKYIKYNKRFSPDYIVYIYIRYDSGWSNFVAFISPLSAIHKALDSNSGIAGRNLFVRSFSRGRCYSV